MLQLNEATVGSDSARVPLFVTPDLFSRRPLNAAHRKWERVKERWRGIMHKAIREFSAASPFWRTAMLELCQLLKLWRGDRRRRRRCCSVSQTRCNHIQRWLSQQDLVDSFAYHSNTCNWKCVWTEGPAARRWDPLRHGQRYSPGYLLLLSPCLALYLIWSDYIHVCLRQEYSQNLLCYLYNLYKLWLL